jgi:hemolysin III
MRRSHLKDRLRGRAGADDGLEGALEEVANSVTHGVGLFLSLAGFAVLIVLACTRGTALHITACALYGATLVATYTASTLYHALRAPRAKQVFKVLDHCAIYLLIAGTYTPFTLVTMRGAWGWTLFGVVWGMTVFGVLLKIFHVNRFKVASVMLYLLMGWMSIVAIQPLLTLAPGGAVLLLLAGGVAYTLGVPFYAWKRLPYNHAVWHLFVLAGSVLHYLAVVFYVVPSTP